MKQLRHKIFSLIILFPLARSLTLKEYGSKIYNVAFKKPPFNEVVFMNIQKIKESQLRCKLRTFNRQKEKQYALRNNLSLIRFSNRCGNHINCFRFNLSESKKHIFKKLEICIELMSKNHKFITEAIFNNGFRCDIFDITDGTVYEIMNSESDKEFEEKVKNYPEELEIVKVRV